jgi:hypothetical protein
VSHKAPYGNKSGSVPPPNDAAMRYCAPCACWWARVLRNRSGRRVYPKCTTELVAKPMIVDELRPGVFAMWSEGDAHVQRMSRA